VAPFILLFVAAGLLILAGTGIGRARGRALSASDAAGMAGMTGVAVAFLFTVMPVMPLAMLPAAIAGVLCVAWIVRGQLLQLGAFLIGGGGFVGLHQAFTLANDLADPAVSVPGWTPLPLAAGAAFVILGAALVAARLTRVRPER
jgi:hypothetical protein